MNYLEYLGAGLLMFGIYLTGERKKIGWIAYLFANFIYIYISLNNKLYGLFSVSIILSFLNVYNFIKWKKLKKK